MALNELVRVILVDDEPALLRVTACLLRSDEVRVESFATPRTAGAALLAEPPDVLVTDFQMPGMTGIELARQIRRALAEACPFVILWTGSRAALSARDEQLVDAVIDKPCDPDDLVRLVRRGSRLRRRRSSGVQLVSSRPPDPRVEREIG